MVSPALNATLLDDLGRIFDWQPDPALYFPTAATEKLRGQLRDALTTGEGVTVLTGTAGAGKTLLLQLSLQDLSGHWSHVAQLSYTSMSGAEILRSAAYAFGMPAGHGDTPTPAAWTENRLRYWARRGEASLLVVDEAQNLPLDALKPLLALSGPQESGAPLLQLIFVGRPAALDLALGNTKPALAMPAFSHDESTAYIADRLRRIAAPGLPVLSEAVMAEIHAHTQGRPGRINLLCKQLLQNAVLLEEDANVDTAAVEAAAEELGFGVADVLETAPLILAPSLAPPAPPVPPTPPPVAPMEPATALVEAAPTRRKSRVLPAALLLLSAAIGAVIFLAGPATSPEPTATTVVPPLPAPPPPESKAAPEPAPPTVQVPSEPPQILPAMAPKAEPAKAARPLPQLQTLPPAPREPAPAAQPTKPAKPVATAVPPAPSPSAKTHCAHLLAQLSLGEPLSAGQQHTLESTCR